MKLWPAAADSGRSAARDWRALRRLLLLEDRSFTRAVDAVRASERALRHNPLGDPAAIARWNEASMEHAHGSAEAGRRGPRVHARHRGVRTQAR